MNYQSQNSNCLIIQLLTNIRDRGVEGKSFEIWKDCVQAANLAQGEIIRRLNEKNMANSENLQLVKDLIQKKREYLETFHNKKTTADDLNKAYKSITDLSYKLEILLEYANLFL